MIPAARFPFHRIRETLVSVLSHRVQKVILDLNIEGGVDTFDECCFQSFGGLDAQLTRIASDYRGVGKTVVELSADDPFVLGLYLTNLRTCGVLVFGTRVGDAPGCGCVQWFDGDGGRLTPL
jgi:hypothetical protein